MRPLVWAQNSHSVKGWQRSGKVCSTQAEGAESQKGFELVTELGGKTRSYGGCLTLEEIKDGYLQAAWELKAENRDWSRDQAESGTRWGWIACSENSGQGPLGHSEEYGLFCKRFYIFIFRESGREGEKHQPVCAGTKPVTQSCALTWNRTQGPSPRGATPSQLGHTSQGEECGFYSKYNGKPWRVLKSRVIRFALFSKDHSSCSMEKASGKL